LVAQWIEQFAPGGTIRVLAVEDNGRLVAALPLVGRRFKGIVELGASPSNCWSICGELLLDPDCKTAAVLDVLVAAIRKLPWSLLVLTEVPFDNPNWQALFAAARRAGMPCHQQLSFPIGEHEIGHDWSAYEATWSGNRRRQLHKAVRRASTEYGARLQTYFPTSAQEVRELLQRGFEIEDHSWKGQDGTSVLRSPGMFDWYCRQCEQLAAWGQAEIVFLETAAGEPMAFEYGFRAKGVYFSQKLGYNPTFSACSPGQVLRYHQFLAYHADPSMSLVDFRGPLIEANARWSTRTYPIGRVLMAPRLLGRVALRGYQTLQPWVQRLRRNGQCAAAVEPKANPAVVVDAGVASARQDSECEAATTRE
jgi:CelD/BcsL family acetyltransferase involved in cellulose biosynthesis